MKVYKTNAAKYRRIGLERIEILFNEADKIFRKNPDLAKKYVIIARKIAMRLKLRFPKDIKRRFCKECSAYLKFGVNCRIRTRDRTVVYKCYSCGHVTRIPFTKERSA